MPTVLEGGLYTQVYMMKKIETFDVNKIGCECCVLMLEMDYNALESTYSK